MVGPLKEEHSRQSGEERVEVGRCKCYWADGSRKMCAGSEGGQVMGNAGNTGVTAGQVGLSGSETT